MGSFKGQQRAYRWNRQSRIARNLTGRHFMIGLRGCRRRERALDCRACSERKFVPEPRFLVRGRRDPPFKSFGQNWPSKGLPAPDSKWSIHPSGPSPLTSTSWTQRHTNDRVFLWSSMTDTSSCGGGDWFSMLDTIKASYSLIGVSVGPRRQDPSVARRGAGGASLQTPKAPAASSRTRPTSP